MADTRDHIAASSSQFDAEELVSLIKRHYKLLLEMGHLPTDPASLQWPPEPTGWSDSQLNVTALRLLGRTETVIDLLRHLPYPRAAPPGSVFHVDPATVDLFAWTRSFLRAQWSPEHCDDPEWYARDWPDVGAHLRVPFLGPVDPGIICLTYHESGLGTMWVIDTQEGCIYPHGDPYYLHNDNLPQEAGDGGKKQWLKARPVSFSEYFDKLCDDLRSLKLVPVPEVDRKHGPDIVTSEDTDDGGKQLQDLYIQHGWPEAFNKEEYLKAAIPIRKALFMPPEQPSGTRGIRTRRRS